MEFRRKDFINKDSFSHRKTMYENIFLQKKVEEWCQGHSHIVSCIWREILLAEKADEKTSKEVTSREAIVKEILAQKNLLDTLPFSVEDLLEYIEYSY